MRPPKFAKATKRKLGRCSAGWYALPQRGGPCKMCGAVKGGTCKAKTSNDWQSRGRCDGPNNINYQV